jgi:hypothetical protein
MFLIGIHCDGRVNYGGGVLHGVLFDFSVCNLVLDFPYFLIHTLFTTIEWICRRKERRDENRSGMGWSWLLDTFSSCIWQRESCLVSQMVPIKSIESFERKAG